VIALNAFWRIDPLPLTLAPMYSTAWWRFYSDVTLRERGWR
jgi:hypothetical protein